MPDGQGDKRGSKHVTASPIPFAAADTLSSPRPGNPGGGSGSGGISFDHVQPGQRIGKYQLVRMLGKGGMGAVFEALDIALHRKVALKILPREFSENDEALKRFIREARLAARLNHPNAVGVYDVGRKGTTYYIAMELVSGASLQQLLESGAAMGWRQATQWLADACRALSAAHAAGLVHRDIKPSNMLCSDSGAVKLSDFGLAKPTDGKNHLTLTQKDAFIGTPLFMSPEQCRNDGIDERSDIYGLGATYYTLLTGEPPYHQGTPLQILFAHCSAPIPDACQHNPDLPPLCGQIVARAMAKDPAQRYQDADEMLADLEALLTGGEAATGGDPMLAAMGELLPQDGQVMEAPPLPDVWRSAYETARYRRWVHLGIAAGAAVLIGGGLIAVLVARSNSSPAPAAIASAASSPAALPAHAAVAVVPPAVHVAPQPEAMPLQSPADERAAIVQPTPAQPVAPAVTVALAQPEKAPATPATAPVELAIAAALPPPPSAAASPAPAAPAADPPPVAQDEPVERPMPREATLSPEALKDPAVMAYKGAKRWTAYAAQRKDAKAIEEGARALVLWHDFFIISPHDFHAPLVDESERLAEYYKPGISRIFPRVEPAAGGPPLPRKIEAPPEGEQPPSPPARTRPPARRPPSGRSR